MQLRSGRATTTLLGGRVKQTAAADADDPCSRMATATATRRVKITSRPSSPEAQAQHGGVDAPPKVPDASNAATVAELGIKLFPRLPRAQAAALWVGFVNDAKTCIKQYNISHKANFVYKHVQPRSTGFYRVVELDDEAYHHMNFLAQDEDGNSQLFFGEIRCRISPQVEDVTCCCPVTSSDDGGKSIRTIEEAIKYNEYPDIGMVGYDPEHCYACTPRMKHPKGTYYVAGHFADIRQYYSF